MKIRYFFPNSFLKIVLEKSIFTPDLNKYNRTIYFEWQFITKLSIECADNAHWFIIFGVTI